MTDLQRIVDEIRFALQAQVCEQTEGLGERAASYAAACHEANERLRRCDDLLRRNLRSEAIHLAEAEPNLLDLVATLDFPERQEWVDVAALYDMADAEPLLVDIAQDLNQAYTTVQPLQKLLAKHRLLALSHAPLNERLDVMRLLDGLDEDASFWDDDIRTFERARFQEIEGSARTAAQKKCETTLISLLDEVATGDWREDVPSHLVATLRKYSGSVSRSGAQEQIGQLTADLESAFGELDLSRARELRTQWLSAAAKARLPETDPVRDQVEPILGWILDEDAREEADRGFQASIAALDRALDGGTDLAELERLYDASMRFERTLPVPIRARFENRTRALELADSRARRLKIGFVAAIALSVAVMATVLTRRQQQNALVAALVASVDPVITSGAYDKARELLAAQPELSERTEIIEQLSRIADEQRRDDERKTRFQAEVGRASQAADYAAAKVALKEAQRHVRFDSEKLAVEDLEHSWQQRRQADMATAEAAFQKDFDAATVDLKRLEAAAEIDPASAQTAELLAAIATQIGALKGAGLQLRPELSSQLDLLTSRHTSYEALRQSTLTRRKISEMLTARVLIAPDSVELPQAVESFGKTLSDYADALGQDPRSDDIREVLAERRHWTATLSWNRLVKSWPILWPAEMNDLTSRIAECERFLKESGDCPESADAREYLAALQAIHAREVGSGDPPGDGLRTKLRRTFSHDLIQGAWFLKTGDGHTYYVSQSDDYSTAKDDALVSPRHRIGYAKEDIKGARGLKAVDLVTKRPLPAAQNKIAKFVIDQTTLLKMDEWDGFMLNLARQIYQASDMDAFLRYDLLTRVLETGSAGSPFFKAAVEPQLQHLKRTSMDPLAHWMDPTDEDADKARNMAKEVLKLMPEFGDVSGRVAESRRALEARLRTSTTMIGWLEQVDGQWTCHTPWTSDVDHDLFVAFCDKPESRAEWRRIGETTGQGLKILAADTSFLRSGRPVFAMPRPASPENVTTK